MAIIMQYIEKNDQVLAIKKKLEEEKKEAEERAETAERDLKTLQRQYNQLESELYYDKLSYSIPQIPVVAYCMQVS